MSADSELALSFGSAADLALSGMVASNRNPLTRRSVIALLGSALLAGHAAAAPPPLFTSMADALRTPDAVTSLLLARIPMDELPPELSQFPRLQTLLLHRNGFKRVGSALPKLRSLQAIYIGGSPELDFEALIAQLSSLPMLSGVGLDDNRMGRVPSNIRGLAACESLGLSSNDLQRLARQLAELPKLKKVDLYNNRLRSIPRQLLESRSLERIFVRECGLTHAELATLAQQWPRIDLDEALPPELYLKLG
jgi:Leucine-rich repeat (LRR) protein